MSKLCRRGFLKMVGMGLAALGMVGIIGHEASGIITETGQNVNQWKVGDRVTFDSTVYCQNCYYCRGGKINLCDNRRVLGVSCNDYRQHGAFAEYVAVPDHILYRLPEAINFERAAMVEALSSALHAVKQVNVTANDTRLPGYDCWR